MNDDSEDEEPPGARADLDVAPDPGITREHFLEWRSPREGAANPQRVNSPVWEWLVRSRLSAFQATEYFDGPSAVTAGPGWCFQRFGQSETLLPDGRVVFIGGEHEDHYDPDFQIYNDVVVHLPDGRIEIFNYPRSLFPPTDFHTATWLGGQIVIIGTLGYAEERVMGTTPVYSLDLSTFAMTRLQTHGTPPGWIHSHQAVLAEDRDSILIRGGLLDRGADDEGLIENIADYRLHLGDGRWQFLTQRNWLRWHLRRLDGKWNHLFQIQQAQWARDHPQLGPPSVEEEIGGPPDLETFAIRYQPDIPHVQIKSDEYNVHRIEVDGVLVRYVEQMDGICLTIEGQLPLPIVRKLTSDLVEKLTRLERAPWMLKEI